TGESAYANRAAGRRNVASAKAYGRTVEAECQGALSERTASQACRGSGADRCGILVGRRALAIRTGKQVGVGNTAGVAAGLGGSGPGQNACDDRAACEPSSRRSPVFAESAAGTCI